jgi:hypothetical protein
MSRLNSRTHGNVTPGEEKNQADLSKETAPARGSNYDKTGNLIRLGPAHAASATRSRTNGIGYPPRFLI